jgi:hypothetical protein
MHFKLYFCLQKYEIKLNVGHQNRNFCVFGCKMLTDSMVAVFVKKLAENWKTVKNTPWQGA